MADTDSHLAIFAPQVRSGEVKPLRNEAQPGLDESHRSENTDDVDRIVRALIAVYLCPLNRTSSHFPCW